MATVNMNKNLMKFVHVVFEIYEWTGTVSRLPLFLGHYCYF